MKTGFIHAPHHDTDIISSALQQVRTASVNDLWSELDEHVRRHERARDVEGINLVAADGPMSARVRSYLSSELGARASGGAIGRDNRVFTGLDHADEIEALCIALLRELFDCAYLDPRSLSGLHANTVVYAALKRHFRVDAIHSLHPHEGGNTCHYHNGPPGVLGYRIERVPVMPSTLQIDLNAAEQQFKRQRPDWISLGAGINLFPLPVRELKELMADWQGKILFDGAHQAGLIAAGVYPNPLTEGADLLTASTGKTFCGPPGGFIAWQHPRWSEAIDTTLFPTLTGTHQLNRIAALVAACLEIKADRGVTMAQGVRLAQHFAIALHQLDVPVLAAEHGYTQTHQIIVPWRAEEGARAACCRLADAGIFVNAVPLPGDEAVLSGIRFGLTELTRQGITPDELVSLAEVVAGVLHRRISVMTGREMSRTLAAALHQGHPSQVGG